MALLDACRHGADAIGAAVIDAKQNLARSKALLLKEVTTSALPHCVQTPGKSRFPALDDLVAMIGRAARRDDPLDPLIAEIKALVTSDVEPATLMGVLLEGIAQTLLQRLPVAEHRLFVVAMHALLCQRTGLARVDLA